MKDLFLSPIISNGMIIQRDVSFPVWSREKITVNFLGKTYHSKNANNKWLIMLDPVQSGGPFEMEIQYNSEKNVIQNIYAGDLWLCAGQSNMEMQMNRLRDDFGEEWNFNAEGALDFSLIRQFKVPQEWDFSGERDDLSGGSWLSASPEKLEEFSAVAWFFAKEFYKKYRIPIGLVNTAWGGTPIEAWMSKDALAEYPAKIAQGRQYADSAKRDEVSNNTNKAIEEWENNLTRDDAGVINCWYNNETDISSWKEITLPGNFSDSGNYGFCGIMWLVKEIDIGTGFLPDGKNSAGANIWLGTIVDSDTVYINGKEIGNTGYRYPPRKYIENGVLKPGKNRIVIRVICRNGEGGITKDKPFCIFTDNASIDLKGEWKHKIGASTTTRPPEFFFQWQPLGNFNAMISPVLKFPYKGVIWYQGESNETNSREYAGLFKLMINDWRKKNIEQRTDNKELPFFFVQLPVFLPSSDNDEKCGWPVLREAQMSALSLPKTGMACALELGEWNDIHPINKKDVGIRLFLAADKELFAAANSSPGPVVREQRTENKKQKIYIYFDNCANGLIVKDEVSPNAFVSVIGKEGQVRVPAKIEGADCISVDLSGITNPQRILYAWADNPKDRQLFNSDGLPAIPFRLEIK